MVITCSFSFYSEIKSSFYCVAELELKKETKKLGGSLSHMLLAVCVSHDGLRSQVLWLKKFPNIGNQLEYREKKKKRTTHTHPAKW